MLKVYVHLQGRLMFDYETLVAPQIGDTYTSNCVPNEFEQTSYVVCDRILNTAMPHLLSVDVKKKY